jgi:hypothetical protein
MSRFSDSLMVYPMLGGAFSEICLNALVTIPVSLTLAQTVVLKSLALWYSAVERAENIKESLRCVGLQSSHLSQVVNQHIQTVERLLNKSGDRFQFVTMGLGTKRPEKSKGRASEVVGAPPVYFRNVDRQLPTNHSYAHPQSTRPAPAGVVGRLAPSAPANVTFLNWFQQHRVHRLAPANTTTLPSVTKEILLRQTMSQPYDNARVSPGAQWARPAASRQPGVAAISPAPGAGTLAAPSPGPNVRVSGLPNLARQTQRRPDSPASMDTVLRITRMPVAGATAETPPAGTRAVAEAMRQLAAIRREERMEPPRLTYAYAQPVRPIVQQDQVVTHVQEKEVVQLVQKEVESQLTAASILKIFSRADYARIADNVYTSLARQLMIERERLGIH